MYSILFCVSHVLEESDYRKKRVVTNRNDKINLKSTKNEFSKKKETAR